MYRVASLSYASGAVSSLRRRSESIALGAPSAAFAHGLATACPVPAAAPAWLSWAWLRIPC